MYPSAQAQSSGASLTISEYWIPVYAHLPSPQFWPSPILAQPLLHLRPDLNTGPPADPLVPAP